VLSGAEMRTAQNLIRSAPLFLPYISRIAN
jgi:hypothetical protein